jgi:hypothetical protein
METLLGKLTDEAIVTIVSLKIFQLLNSARLTEPILKSRILNHKTNQPTLSDLLPVIPTEALLRPATGLLLPLLDSLFARKRRAFGSL